MRSRYDIYCDIIYHGLLQIRATSDIELCKIQADHLHNMPDLLKNLNNEDLHDFYWNCMRPDPESEAGRIFINLWAELEEARARENKR